LAVTWQSWPGPTDIAERLVYERLRSDAKRVISLEFDLALPFTIEPNQPTEAAPIHFDRVEVSGHVVNFRRDASTADRDRAAKEYYDVLIQLTSARRMGTAVPALILWTAPAAGSYFMGWLVGWIAGGFRRSRGGS
jgi:hypothetical protein